MRTVLRGALEMVAVLGAAVLLYLVLVFGGP